MVPTPTPEPTPGAQPGIQSGPTSILTPLPISPDPQKVSTFHLTFEATREQLFKIWNAIANLADKAGKVRVEVDAKSDEGFDPTWLRNAVQEPLEEADVLKDKKEGNQEDG